MKKLIAILLMTSLALISVFAGGSQEQSGVKTYKIGICNFVDDASLNQICENIQAQLAEIESEKGVKFDIKYDNCNADANVLAQIIANFIADDVDLMVGIATPVAMAMQAATEDNNIPVVFAAVSDPLAAGVVSSLSAPGANLTGTSDFLDTTAVMNLVFALKPDADKIGLLYSTSEDASTQAIADAKAFLDAKGVEYVEKTGTNTTEVSQAADALIAAGVDAIFTPTDNTVMSAELSIYDKLADAGIPHYTGADSFALNGAFLGFGINYADLGSETADMVANILVNGQDPASYAVVTLGNGIATINTETAERLGVDLKATEEAFKPYCSEIVETVTAENFED